MVESWQLVVASSGILVTVFAVYGALIKVVYDSVMELQQRLFGADTDETDPGFVGETVERFDHLERSQHEIRRENEQQSRLLTSIAYGIEDLVAALDKSEGVDVDLDHVRLRDDFYHTDDPETNAGPQSGDPVPDGSGGSLFNSVLPPAPWHEHGPRLDASAWGCGWTFK